MVFDCFGRQRRGTVYDINGTIGVAPADGGEPIYMEERFMTTDPTGGLAIPVDDGLHADVPEADYHADRGSLSVSGAKLLLPPSCPAKFRESQDNPPPPRPHFDFGSLAHALILGNGPELEILDPAVHGLKADGAIADVPQMTGMWKKAAAAARAEGKLPVSTADHLAAQAMRDAVMAHPVAGGLFTDGDAEVSAYRHDEQTGVRLRGRMDWLRGDGTIVDLKTSATANPAELVRRFWQYGYFMQNAWYVDLLGDPDAEFLFVVVEKVPPYVVTVLRYDADAIAEGRRLNRLAIDTYARCVRDGIWPDYSDQVVTLSLPPWALRDGNQDAAQQLIDELEGIAG